MYSEKEIKKAKKREANSELTQWNAMKVLIKNNDLSASVEIAGVLLAVCNNNQLLPIIEYNISEIQKYLNGKSNLWE